MSFAVFLWAEGEPARVKLARLLRETGADVEVFSDSLDATLAAASKAFRLLVVRAPIAQTDLGEWLTALPELGQAHGAVWLLHPATGEPVAFTVPPGLTMEVRIDDAASHQELRDLLTAPADDVLAELARLKADYGEGLPALLHEVHAALEASDLVRARRLAHKVAGGAGMYGFAETGAQLRALELHLDRVIDAPSAAGLGEARKLLAQAVERSGKT